MSELLQTIAGRNTLYLTDLASAFQDEDRALESLPVAQQGQRALTDARTILQQIPSAASMVENWIGSVEERLRQGINGDEFRLIARGGELLLRSALMIVESANQFWTRVSALSNTSVELEQARKTIDIIRERILAAKRPITQWRKLADRKSPEIDSAKAERGAEQIRQGQFKTGEQILEVIRNRDVVK